MRVNDRAVPATTGVRPPRPNGWRADLFVAVERLPTAAYHWDDYVAAWGRSGFVWDDVAVAVAMTDVTCDLAGVEIEVGNPDDEGRMDAGHLTMTLLNAFGQWSQYDAFGRLTAYEPGSRLDVWARHNGEDWWLFSGIVAAWDEAADGTVEVEAFDRFADLARPIGTWSPGTRGQLPHERLATILTNTAPTVARRLDVGQVTLHAFDTTASPLEEAQAVAQSDGGYVVVDADGTILYRNRAWTGGRADQTEIRKFSDNVCGTRSMVWDARLATDDDVKATDVTLTNVEDVAARSTVPGRLFAYTRKGDQWMLATEGQTLADAMIRRRSQSYLRVDGFTMHLLDPQQNLWRAGLDLRMGDLVRFLHDQATPTGTARLDLNLVVQAITHRITPEVWELDVSTTRAVGNNIIYRWDGPGMAWDRAPAEWTN